MTTLIDTATADGTMFPPALANYDMGFVFDRLRGQGEIFETRREELEREFKKFIALVSFGLTPLAMIGPAVDEVWHQYVLFTKKYREFSHDVLGFFLDHTPDTDADPLPVAAGENFRSGYRRHFGPLPEIWYVGMDAATRTYYESPQLIGRPPMRWSGWVGHASAPSS